MSDLNKDAAFVQAVRKALDNGASVTLTRPLQSIIIKLENLTPEDRRAIQLAFNVVYYD